jgi:hypothetical protein
LAGRSRETRVMARPGAQDKSPRLTALTGGGGFGLGVARQCHGDELGGLVDRGGMDFCWDHLPPKESLGTRGVWRRGRMSLFHQPHGVACSSLEKKTLGLC